MRKCADLNPPLPALNTKSSFETDYANTHSDLPAQDFTGAGAVERDFVVNNLLKLERAFENRNYPNLRLQTRVVEDETHPSVIPQNISKGLEVVYG